MLAIIVSVGVTGMVSMGTVANIGRFSFLGVRVAVLAVAVCVRMSLAMTLPVIASGVVLVIVVAVAFVPF